MAFCLLSPIQLDRKRRKLESTLGKMKKQAAGQRNMRQGRGLGRAGGGAQNQAQAKKGQLPNLRDIPPSEQGKFRSKGLRSRFAPFNP